MTELQAEIAATAARLVVEDGLDFGAAKRRAARDLGVAERGMLPDNEELEQAVREYLELFAQESQPRELHELRCLALRWMERLGKFRPYICGAVWNGTATARSGIHLELYCDDTKMAEVALVNLGARMLPSGPRSCDDGATSRVSFTDQSNELSVIVNILVDVRDYDEIRGGLRGNRRGQVTRGDARQLQQLVSARNDA